MELGLFLCKESQSRHKRALEPILILEANSSVPLPQPRGPTRDREPDPEGTKTHLQKANY